MKAVSRYHRAQDVCVCDGSARHSRSEIRREAVLSALHTAFFCGLKSVRRSAEKVPGGHRYCISGTLRHLYIHLHTHTRRQLSATSDAILSRAQLPLRARAP